MLDHLFCAICQEFKNHNVVEEANEAIVTCEDCGHSLKFDPTQLAEQLDAHNAANTPQIAKDEPQSVEEVIVPAETPVVPQNEDAAEEAAVEGELPAKS